ncbi:MAG: hypothetical protein ABIN91_07055 [Mucilaginibacter sp.]|uniref:hypothetical protein n=1 Tax=Mucilaginibacter sp. TaxID=1882438 RepID=UPI003264DB64
MKQLLPAAFILCLFLAACDDDNGDKAKEVDTKGSIAVTLSTQHIDSLKDLVTTHYVVWKQGAKLKEFDVKDTIPSLGKTKTEGEDDDGNTKDMVIPKDYDFFVTVK